MTLLLLIRHGETALNAARVLQPADTPLSPRGLAQAEALAQRLRSAGLRALVSSDLPRARLTAEAIARATALALPADDDPLATLLHERHFGALRGLPYDQLQGNPLAMEEAPPGGESLAAFQARVDAAWAELLRRAAALDGPLAVVTHGLVIHDLLSRHVTWPAQGANGAPPALRPARLRNTSVSVLDARPPHAVHLADCIAHLDEALRAPSDALTGG